MTSEVHALLPDASCSANKASVISQECHPPKSAKHYPINYLMLHKEFSLCSIWLVAVQNTLPQAVQVHATNTTCRAHVVVTSTCLEIKIQASVQVICSKMMRVKQTPDSLTSASDA